MPRSPADGRHLARYDDAWEAINQMIREGGSWSGFERNCFYFGAGDGTFANLSAASGLDYIDDGRALALLDWDRDGDLDMILKNRSGPQLRILRNDYPAANQSIAFRLEGKPPANRDAVGARVTLRHGKKIATKTVTCGSLFLSQSTRWLYFGLGKEKVVEQVEVRWPSGKIQTFKNLAAGRRYRLVEGGEPGGEEFMERSKPAHEKSTIPNPMVDDGIRRGPESELWLLAECRLPEVPIPTFFVKPIDFSRWRGKAFLINFFSRRCRPCVQEFQEWGQQIEMLKKIELTIVPVTVDGADLKQLQETWSFLHELGFPELLGVADDRVLAAYGALIHQVARWPVDFVAPTSLLIGHDGQVAKIYRGAIGWEHLIDDAARLHQAPDRRRLALPFPGVYYSGQPVRDYFHLGLGYWERGLQDLAIGAFERGLEQRPGDADLAYNIGVLRLEKNQLDEAIQAFKKAIEADADFVDAYSNLGVVLAQSGDLAGALERFQEAQRLRPGYAEPLLNEANVHLKLGNWDKAVEIYEQVRRMEPLLADVHKRLGEAYHRRGEAPRAIAAFQEALRLEPDDAEARSNLAVVHASLGKFSEARAELEEVLRKHPGYAAAHNNLGLVLQALGEAGAALQSFRQAVRLKPELAEATLNLAKLLLKQGEKKEAKAVLDRYLEGQPGHPAIQALRGSIKN